MVFDSVSQKFSILATIDTHVEKGLAMGLLDRRVATK